MRGVKKGSTRGGGQKGAIFCCLWVAAMMACEWTISGGAGLDSTLWAADIVACEWAHCGDMWGPPMIGRQCTSHVDLRRGTPKGHSRSVLTGEKLRMLGCSCKSLMGQGQVYLRRGRGAGVCDSRGFVPKKAQQSIRFTKIDSPPHGEFFDGPGGGGGLRRGG